MTQFGTSTASSSKNDLASFPRPKRSATALISTAQSSSETVIEEVVLADVSNNAMVRIYSTLYPLILPSIDYLLASLKLEFINGLKELYQNGLISPSDPESWFDTLEHTTTPITTSNLRTLYPEAAPMNVWHLGLQVTDSLRTHLTLRRRHHLDADIQSGDDGSYKSAIGELESLVSISRHAFLCRILNETHILALQLGVASNGAQKPGKNTPKLGLHIPTTPHHRVLQPLDSGFAFPQMVESPSTPSFMSASTSALPPQLSRARTISLVSAFRYRHTRQAPSSAELKLQKAEPSSAISPVDAPSLITPTFASPKNGALNSLKFFVSQPSNTFNHHPQSSDNHYVPIIRPKPHARKPIPWRISHIRTFSSPNPHVSSTSPKMLSPPTSPNTPVLTRTVTPSDSETSSVQASPAVTPRCLVVPPTTPLSFTATTKTSKLLSKPVEMDPLLVALENASRLHVGGQCAVCSKTGANFPRCGRCGEAWCSRDCRLLGSRGKKHACKGASALVTKIC
jgi:hypothetical protein